MTLVAFSSKIRSALASVFNGKNHAVWFLYPAQCFLPLITGFNLRYRLEIMIGIYQ